MNKQNSFEAYYKAFVTDFGGSVLPEANDVKTADYWFPKYNVLAELKTLSEDSTLAMDELLKNAVLSWGGDFTKIPIKTDSNGFPYVGQEHIPDEVRKKWTDKQFQQIERLVKQAQKQIASTKVRAGLSTARGVILVSNSGNPYHNNPLSYREALGALILKRAPAGGRKYPAIDGGVYFSKDLKSREHGAPFWAPFHVEQPGNPVGAEISSFLLDLRTGWYTYIEKTTGVTVRQHDVD